MTKRELIGIIEEYILCRIDYSWKPENREVEKNLEDAEEQFNTFIEQLPIED